MRITTITRVLLAAATVLSFAARAQDYPGNPIHIVVPSAAGATTDALARIVGERFQRKWGQPVVIEDRAGAGGNIGAEYVARMQAAVSALGHPGQLDVARVATRSYPSQWKPSMIGMTSSLSLSATVTSTSPLGIGASPAATRLFQSAGAKE